MRVEITAIVTAFMLACTPALAHDFWIQPSRFQVNQGDSISFRFLIGEPGAIEYWETEWKKVVSLQDIGPMTISDRLSAIRPLNGKAAEIDRIDATMTFAEPGTHIVSFVSNQAVNDLNADA